MKPPYMSLIHVLYTMKYFFELSTSSELKMIWLKCTLVTRTSYSKVAFQK